MNFLINTITHWEEPPRARHQVAYALSKNHKVVFVSANKTGFPAIRIKQLHENLIIINPYFLIDSRIRYRIPFLNELYQIWLFRKLIKEYKTYEVINFDFTATKIFNYFLNVIYYCNDSFSAISKHINPRLITKYHIKCESVIAKKSKFCIAVSDILRENLIRYNKNTFVIPLGSPEIAEYNININLSPSKNKIIHVGFVGFIKSLNLSHKILNLLIYNKNIRLTLIGPVEDNFLEHIKGSKEKIITTGALTGKQLYEEINNFDVAIAPYSSRLTKDKNAGVGTGSKIYHYFALGKPVVISNMAGLSNMHLPDGLMYIAQSEEDFPTLIFKAHEENSEELIRQRITYANNNTWSKRMEDLIAYYEKV